jgi:microsomal dipeptidase-like Zn-dependent dipeptidase
LEIIVQERRSNGSLRFRRSLSCRSRNPASMPHTCASPQVAAPGEDENVFNFLPDLNTPRRFETLADMLLARRHSEARVEKILGGNFARVFAEVLGA